MHLFPYHLVREEPRLLMLFPSFRKICNYTKFKYL